MAYSRRSYKGAPVANAIGGSTLAAGATSITLSSSISGSWSTGSNPFFVVIDPGTAKEEKVCVIYNTSTNLTVVDPAATSGWTANIAGRGADDTTDRAHDVGAVIYPVFTATEANQANELVSKYATNGDLVAHGSTGLKTVATGGSGNNNKILTADSTVDGGIKWSTISTASITDSAVTSAKIADGTIVAGDIADGAITSAKILDGTIVLDDLAAALQNFLVPVGTINAYAGATAPTGWLLCNGTPTTGYTALAALVGATTPDLQGHTLVGKSASAPFNGALLTKFGSTTSVANHDHTATTSVALSDPGHNHVQSTEFQKVYNTSDSDLLTVNQTSVAVNPTVTSSNTTGITVSSASTTVAARGDTHGNVQPSALVNYIIKHD